MLHPMKDMFSWQNTIPTLGFRFLLILCLVFSSQAKTAGNAPSGEKKALICSACHGAQGVSNNPEWPHLAGQHASYLSKQLMDFKQGTRQAPTMTPLVSNLSTEDIADIAAYYEQLPPLSTTKIEPTSKTRGQILYKEGNKEQKITACITCHGPDGRGNAEAGFPSLRHQSMIYLEQQMHAFKSHQRKNDLNGLMHDISQHLSDDDITALSDYISKIP